MFYFYILPMIICIISTLLIYLRLKVVKIEFGKEDHLTELYANIRYLIFICTPIINIFFAATLFTVAIIISEENFKEIFDNEKNLNN